MARAELDLAEPGKTMARAEPWLNPLLQRPAWCKFLRVDLRVAEANIGPPLVFFVVHSVTRIIRSKQQCQGGGGEDWSRVFEPMFLKELLFSHIKKSHFSNVWLVAKVVDYGANHVDTIWDNFDHPPFLCGHLLNSCF